MSMKVGKFGRLIEEPIKKEGKQVGKFGRLIEESPKTEEKFRPGAGGKAALRGLYKAAKEMTKTSPLSALMGGALPGPVSEEFLDEAIQKYIGDPESGFSEKVVERGVETLPYLLGGEGTFIGKLGRAGLTGLLGQATEEAGGGELAQIAAEIAALGLPGVAKKIIPRKGQEKTLKMLRRRGLSEKEIAPLIPGKTESEILGAIAKKGGRGQKATRKTQKALGRVYDQLKIEGSKGPILATNNSSILENNLKNVIDEFPEEVAKLIRADMEKTFRKPITSNLLMDLWFKINDSIYGKKVTGKRGLLNKLKSPILEAMEDINPQIAEDFSLVQKNYAHFKNTVAKVFKPNLIDRFLKIGKLKQFIIPLVTGSAIGLKGALLTEGARRITTEFLINPRLQNLTRQMIHAINVNKIAIAKKIEQKMIEELKKQGIKEIPEGISISQKANKQ